MRMCVKVVGRGRGVAPTNVPMGVGGGGRGQPGGFPPEHSVVSTAIATLTWA